MRVSFKFFALAYAVVLLSTGLGGIVLIRTITSEQWNTRVQTVESASVYAVDSFLAYTDVLPQVLTDQQLNQIADQIENTLDSAVREVEILPQRRFALAEETLSTNEGVYSFREDEGRLLMEAKCRVKTEAGVYLVCLDSDFTQARHECRALWQGYSVVVLCLSVVSGLLIYCLTKTVTRPLDRLAASAQRIAAGEYGKTVEVRSRDREIVELAESFNGMSQTVAQTIEQITEEVDKRERFVADFAHEMKTPMTAIIGYAQLLHRYELTEEERREAAGAIYNEGKRLEKLSLQMLDWSVYRRGDAQLVPLRLSVLAESLAATLRVLSEKYALPYTLELHEETVIADEVLLLSLLYNLADNAFKASTTSGIAIYSALHADGVEIGVKDNGRGIAPENIKRLTEPFFREDKSRSRAQGGAGLGLSICQQIAAIHGATLRFDSVQGAGTVVSFVLKKGGEAS